MKPLKQYASHAEFKAVLAALSRNDWNKSNAARELSIDRKTLYNKMKKLGIPMNDDPVLWWECQACSHHFDVAPDRMQCTICLCKNVEPVGFTV